MKNRYAMAMNNLLGYRATVQLKRGCTRRVPASVPVKSQARFSTPPATAISSRMGRMM